MTEPRTRRRAFLALCGTATASLAGCVESSDGPGDTEGSPSETRDEPPSENGTSGTPAEGGQNDPEAGEQTPESGGGWPRYGFDLRNRGFNSAASGPRTDTEIRWTHDAGTPTLNSSPVIVGDTVYGTGTGDPGGLFALDLQSGEERWHADTDGYVTGAPVVTDETVYVGTWNQQVQAFDRDTGDLDWTLDVEHRVGTAVPRLVDGTLYVATLGDGPLVVRGEEDEEQFEPPALVAVDVEDGEELWRFDEFGDRDSIRSPLAVTDEYVLFTNEGTVYAFDPASRTVEWSTQTESAPELGPAVADEHVLVGGRSEEGAAVVALDLQDGTERWRTALEAATFRVSPAVADGVVYAATSRREVCPDVADSDCDPESWGRLYAFDLAGGDVDWRADMRPDMRSAPAVTDETVYVGNGDGVSAVARSDGDVRWELSFADDGDEPYVKSSPAVADDLLVIGASDGTLRGVVATD